MRHTHDINAESRQFLGPLTFEVGDGGCHDVGEFITSTNPGERTGAQEMGTSLTMS